MIFSDKWTYQTFEIEKAVASEIVATRRDYLKQIETSKEICVFYSKRDSDNHLQLIDGSSQKSIGGQKLRLFLYVATDFERARYMEAG